MSRTQKFAWWSALGGVALLATGIAFVTTFNWNHAKPWLNQHLSAAIGRPFAIQGDLSLSWHRFGAEQAGWQRWLPWPLLQAQQVTVGNPPEIQSAAAADANMATARSVTFALELLPLLGKKIVIPSLTLNTPELSLRREADGRNNWTLKSNGASAWKFELGQLRVNHGKLRLNDAMRKLELDAEIHTLERDRSDRYGIGWKLNGKYNQAPVSGSGRAGAVLSLRDSKQPFPLEAELKVGKTTIAVSGSIINPADLAAVDMQLKLSGASMAHLYPLTGIVLPETPPFSTTGHLSGNRTQQHWVYDKFSGRVGSSDLAGTLEYQWAKPRPKLSGTLLSQRLVLTDLAPLIGADSNASKARRDAGQMQPPDKALPVEKFKTERWTALDAEIEFSGRRIVREAALPIDDLKTSLHLKDGILSLTPLNFGIAAGDLRSDIKLDGNQRPLKAQWTMSARHLKLRQLFPTVKKMEASLGEINGDAALSGSGDSIASLLGSSNGEIKLLMTQGTISKLLLEQMGLNVGNIVLAKLFGDEQVRINCAAGDFAVSNGVMQAKTFLVDTQEALVNITGEVDLGKEQLALTLKPDTKNLRILSLRAPLYVTGSFKQPKIGVDVGVVALKAGGALALGLAAPLAALLPLINANSDPENHCAALLENASKRPKMPAPGKPYNSKRSPKIAAQPAN